MKAIQAKYSQLNRKPKSNIMIKTTLYDLMETVIDFVGPDDDKMVKDVTLNILTKARSKVRVAYY